MNKYATLATSIPLKAEEFKIIGVLIIWSYGEVPKTHILRGGVLEVTHQFEEIINREGVFPANIAYLSFGLSNEISIRGAKKVDPYSDTMWRKREYNLMDYSRDILAALEDNANISEWLPLFAQAYTLRCAFDEKEAK